MRQFLRWMRAILQSRRLDDETRRELEYHVERETAEAMRSGQSAKEARREALLVLGGADRYRELSRDARGTRALEDALQDVRYGVRGLRRDPGFALVAVLTLALGVGANTAIFSVVNGVLLRELPYAEPERLVSVWGGSRAEYVGLRDRATQFEALGYYAPSVHFTLSGTVEPELIAGAAVTGQIFDVLRVAPFLGRVIAPGEELPGREAVVVLSHSLWRERFGSDPAVLGQRIEVDGTPRTIVGVMPEGFAFPGPQARLWVPFPIDASSVGLYWGGYGGRTIGRLRAGVTREQALAEVRTVAARLRLENPVWTPDETWYINNVAVTPLRDHMVADSRLLLLVLLGAAGLVLLIACVNVANLLLVRGAARESEMALRGALGAGRGRLLRQVATESLVLSFFGGAAGILLALAGVRILVSLLPPETPRLADVAVDANALVFALMIALLTGLVFGLVPATRLAASGSRAAHAGARAVGMTKRRLASALVSAEVAIAIVLVVGATLLLRSLWRLQQVDPGFRVEQLLSARVSLPAARYPSPAAQAAFWSQLREQLGASPGVVALAATTQLPFDGNTQSLAMWIDGYTTDPNRLDVLEWRRVTPGLPQAMGIRLLEGRDFDERDRIGSAPVAYVDERAAAMFWPGRSPVGGRVRYPWGGDWLTVVGVVGSMRNEQLAAEAQPAVYVPMAQNPLVSAMIALRTTDVGQSLADLRSVVARLAPDAPVSDVRTLEQRLSDSITRPRAATALVGTFGVVALLLGAVGTYGVMAWVTGRRRREIAVRMALGARARDVIGLVVGQGAVLALAGTAGGILLAFALTRLLRDLLFEVSPTDPLTFVLVPSLLASIALFASWIPARRASRLRPMTALRNE